MRARLEDGGWSFRVLVGVGDVVDVTFDLEVEPPAFGDPGLPEIGVAALGILVGVERTVAEVAEEKGELLEKRPRDVVRRGGELLSDALGDDGAHAPGAAS